MDAVEFLKAKKRMCKKYNKTACEGCPLYNENKLCSLYIDNEKEVVRKVEEWYKQRPEIELTEQQITAIKGRIAEGAKWAFKNNIELGCVFFTDTKPYIDDNILFVFNKDNAKYISTCNDDFYDFVTFENSPISLVELLKEEK